MFARKNTKSKKKHIGTSRHQPRIPKRNAKQSARFFKAQNEMMKDHFTFDKSGNNIFGFNKKGIHKTTKTKYNPKGYNRDGFNKYGRNADGFDFWGFNKQGINEETGTIFNRVGYTSKHFKNKK